MSSNLDAIGCEERVELTARFLVELEDYLNEAVTAFPGQHVSEIGSHLVRLFVFASVLNLVLPVSGGPEAATEKVWSQCEGRQQSQRKEAFCSINEYQSRRSPSGGLASSGQTTGAVPCARGVPYPLK